MSEGRARAARAREPHGPARAPSTTREQRMYATWKAAYTYDWIRRGEGPGPWLAVARAFRVPIAHVRAVISEEKVRRAAKGKS